MFSLIRCKDILQYC